MMVEKREKETSRDLLLHFLCTKNINADVEIHHFLWINFYLMQCKMK